ncbi:hypothetical protein QYR59_01080 [Streptococcus iniae]|nr:hypothetical protein QYR59_01080 [Streptococcus iniae]
MGGINVTLIINNDKTLKIYSLLNRESDGKLVEILSIILCKHKSRVFEY